MLAMLLMLMIVGELAIMLVLVGAIKDIDKLEEEVLELKVKEDRK